MTIQKALDLGDSTDCMSGRGGEVARTGYCVDVSTQRLGDGVKKGKELLITEAL